MIAAYLRVSSDEQRRAGTIENQRLAIARYCETQQLALDDMYQDDGVTGTIPMEDRPEGHRLMADARTGKLQKVIIYNTDRLGRDEDGIIAVQTIRELRKLGVKVTSITEPMLDDSPHGRFMLNVNSGVAALDRGKFLERSRNGSQRLALKGNYLGGTVSFGYRVEVKDSNARLMLNDEPLPGQSWSEVKIVSLVYDLAAKGNSCQRIADHLHNIGVPTPRSHLGKRARWGREMVRRIIISQLYKGVLTYGKRTRVKDSIPPRFKVVPRKDWITVERAELAIVDEKLWAQANAAVKQNQLAQMAHPKHEYLLSGLITCADCKRNYIGMGIAYRCNGRQQARSHGVPKCTGKTIRRTSLEAAVWDDLRGFLKQPGLVIRQLKQQLDATDGGRDTVRTEIRQMEKALAHRAEAGKRNLQLHNDGECTREEYNAERARIDKEKASIEQSLLALRKSAEDLDSNVRVLQGAESVLESLRAKTDKNPPFAVRRELAQALVERVIIETIDGLATPKITLVYRFDSNYNRYVDEGRAQPIHGKRSELRGPARGIPGH